MNLILFPEKNFDTKSIKTMNKLIRIAEKLLSKWRVPSPKNIEFYDTIDLFIKRILFQVKAYGLTEKQSKEFIKASLNSGSYGTFNIKNNSIVEMNFNRSEEHTSELQSHSFISYAVFCLKKKKKKIYKILTQTYIKTKYTKTT